MSDTDNTTLTALELDALTELVNLGVGRAAVGLREMVGEEVLLSVPALSTVSPEQAAEMIGGVRAGELVAVEQYFAGDVSGRALLIFPEAASLELVKAVTRDSAPADQIPDLAPEALCETGNIVLQACLGTIANNLNRTFAMNVPQLVRGRPSDLFAKAATTTVLFVYINFAVGGRRIRGYIALLMDLPSLQVLKALVSDFIDRETG